MKSIRLCALMASFFLLSVSGLQAAAVSKLLVGNLTATNNNFLGVGVPTPFFLYLTFGDAGAITNGTLKTQSGTDLATIQAAGSGWVLGDGGTDQLTVNAFTNSPGNIIQFTLSGGPNVINSSSNALGTNVEPFFGVGAVNLPSLFTFGTFGGAGYSGQITAVPEPGTMALLLGSVAGIGFVRRRRSA